MHPCSCNGGARKCNTYPPPHHSIAMLCILHGYKVSHVHWNTLDISWHGHHDALISSSSIVQVCMFTHARLHPDQVHGIASREEDE
mmetsp:Transcript_10352/g.20225  ORF Transcript_10352/g.20225 Transcript_10352/m.20225 type:complete len:86 (-) Transcript_10352:49-306(-)